jgi:serine/threonine-protein kinase mTOR
VEIDTNNFSPNYTDVHAQYARQLLQDAGGLKRIQIQHQLYLAFIKHLWSMDQRDEALHRLKRLSNIVDLIAHCVEGTSASHLCVSCWIELGEYMLEETASPVSQIPLHLQVKVLSSFKRATSVPDCGYKAWHSWTLLNFRIAQQMNDTKEGASTQHRNMASLDMLRDHVIETVKGFTDAISLGTNRWSASVQQDLLNLLPICLFKYGDLEKVASTINHGIGIITLEAWLGVLPQLLARIQIRHVAIRAVLHAMLTRLGKKHPQALMYSMSVFLKGPVAERKVAAESLMTSLKAHSNSLVEEALMVSSKLIRVAIL